MTAAVIGTTSWGTTLAVCLARSGARVSLWARTREEALALGETPSLPRTLSVVWSLGEALKGVEVVVLAVPSQAVRSSARLLREHLGGSPILINAAKGLEADTALRMSQVLVQELPALESRVCALSGPNLAREIAQGLPAATVVACQDRGLAEEARRKLRLAGVTVYTSQDIVGVELAGALKNVIAMAAGLVEGLGYGDNARATLMARGLGEMVALGLACGAQEKTFYGLAGVGDLIVTGMSPLSRNHRVGLGLARGQALPDILASLGGVAEGIPTAQGAFLLARKQGVAMPITQAVHRVLFQGLDPKEAARELLGFDA